MSIRTVNKIDRVTGVTWVTSALADSTGDSWLNTGKEFVLIGTAGTNVTVRATPVATLDGLTASPHSYAITTPNGLLIGPFPPSLYNDANGYAKVTYAATPTNVTIKVFQLVAELS